MAIYTRIGNNGKPLTMAQIDNNYVVLSGLTLSTVTISDGIGVNITGAAQTIGSDPSFTVNMAAEDIATALTTPDTGDKIPIGDISANTTKYITYANLRTDILSSATLDSVTTNNNVTTNTITTGTITTPGIQLNTTTPTTPSAEGLFAWDPDNGTASIGMPGGNVNLQLGQELVFRAKNAETTTIVNGTVVYIFGATGGNPLIKRANSSTYPIASAIFGITTEDILPNQPGYVTFFGLVRDMDTNAFNEGDNLFLDTNGALINTLSAPPSASTFVGVVLRKHATEGVIGANPKTAPRLQDLSFVNHLTALSTTGQMVTWDNTNGYFDFTYNITDYLPLAGGTMTGNIVMGANLITTTSSGTSANWGTAYGWGDWSTGVTKVFIDALNVDSDTLDSQHGSYYLDYNNFTNKPTVSGTVNTIAKFTSTTGVGDSNITDNGSTIDTTKPLNVYNSVSGSTVFSVTGTQGTLFNVVDDLSGSLFSVNDISGLPILEVFSDDTIIMGAYLNPAIHIVGSDTGFGTDTPSEKVEVVGNILATSFIKDGGTASQFLKADGSIDSNTYLTAQTDSQTLSWVSGTGQLTISNGNSISLDGRYGLLGSYDYSTALTGDDIFSNITVVDGVVTGISTRVLSASNLTTGTLPIGQVPTGTTVTTVALGNHNHSGVYQPLATVLTNTTASFTTTLAGNIATNNAKVSNVTTNLTTTHNASTVVINSSDGTNATINAATATTAGIMSEAIYDQHVLNNAKISFDSTSSTRLLNTSGTNTGDNATNTQYSGLVSNATHSGEVTGATALTLGKTSISNRTAVTPVGTDYLLIGDTSDSANLKKALISGLPFNNYVLTKAGVEAVLTGTITSHDHDGEYLASYTETDPVFLAHDAYDVTAALMTNWGTAYTHSQAAHAPVGAQANEYSYKTISVATQSDIVADSVTDTLTFINGSNVTITTNATTDSITIASAHPNISAASTSNNSGRTYIQDITLDSDGHITGLATATETVTDTTYTSGDFTHDSLSGVDVNEHLDWTTDRGATNIHTGNYTNTTYLGGTGITLSSTTFNHTNSVTAGTASGTATKTLTYGEAFNIPTVTYDAQGHVTGKGVTTLTLPASDEQNTWRPVTAGGNTLTTSETLAFTQGANVTITEAAGAVTIAATNTTYTAGTALDLVGTVFSHEDTSSQASVNGSGRTYIQDVTLDAMGHVTGLATATETVTDTTYTSSDFVHDDLTGFVTNEHIDWTLSSQGTIHSTNYTNTTYTGGTGITLSSTTFNHTNSVTAGTASGTATSTLSHGGTFNIPTVTYDAQGHVTAKGITTLTLPSDNNTWRPVTAGGNTLTTSETLAFTAGTNITITEAAGAVTINSTYTNTTYTAGTGLDLTSTVFSHEDTSSQASINGSGRTYIQDVTLDAMGHVTGLATATETVTDTTYVSSDFTHDSLSGVDANEHIDWTIDQGATNIHINNYVIGTPTAPTNLVLTQTNDEVLVSFTNSVTTGVNNYEIWASVGTTTDYNLVGIIKEDDITSSMSIVDGTFNINDTIYYKVYAIKNNVYSSALSGNVVLSGNVSDVTNLTVTETIDGFFVTYTLPPDNRLANIEIYVDNHSVLGNLLEANATLTYSGNDEMFFYKIPSGDADDYHQFWVNTITNV